jgi:hypothetical protein
MAQEYSNENRGSIWKNDKKETDNHPDFTGSLNVNGVDFWVSAWKRKADASPKAPSLTFTVKPKDEAKSASSQKTASNDAMDFDDDVPF